MRLWSLHPKYLDPKGLVALWREALLARAVLKNLTHGYRSHPQLERFQKHISPILAIDRYLLNVYEESLLRGYAFDKSKIMPVKDTDNISVATGQLDYEWKHLLIKLSARSPKIYEKWSRISSPDIHPLFCQDVGPIAYWEKLRQVD